MSARDPGRLEARPQLGDRSLDVALAALSAGVEQLRQLAESLGLEDLEGEVLELPLHLPDTEPLRKRRVDLHRLAGDPLLLVRRQPVQRPHVVEPVAELDEDDPDVLGHRQQHLPDVLGLLLLVAVGAELRELRDAVDELGDLGPEPFLDVGQAVLGVLGDVVEERRLDGGEIETELREDAGRRDRVGDVRLPGRSLLAFVGEHGEIERALDRREVGPRVGREDGGVEVRAEGIDIDARRVAPARSPARAAGREGLAIGGRLRSRRRRCHLVPRIAVAPIRPAADRSSTGRGQP